MPAASIPARFTGPISSGEQEKLADDVSRVAHTRTWPRTGPRFRHGSLANDVFVVHRQQAALGMPALTLGHATRR